MSEKPKIKVIKKHQIKLAEATKVQPAKTKREAAREVVSTVTTWVSDFQARKRVETKAAIEKFIVQPQTN
jgi:hypothetical protein